MKAHPIGHFPATENTDAMMSSVADLPVADAAANVPSCSTEQATRFVRENWGIEGVLTPLPGERDRNFLVDPGGPEKGLRYVFKIANGDESRELLEAQHQAFTAIRECPDIDGIQTMLSLQGHPISTFHGDAGACHDCRLTTFLEGHLLSDVVPRTGDLHRSLGRVVAQTGEALQSVSSDLIRRPLIWDFNYGEAVIAAFSKEIRDPRQRALVSKLGGEAITCLAAFDRLLPTGVIHNDANDNNVVVRWSDPWSPTVIGLIDLGDMVSGWRVADLAIACAYAMLGQETPLDVAADVVAGYHAVRPLSEDELHAIAPLIVLRLCMSVCIAAHQQSIQPDNRYLGVSERDAWNMLAQLERVPLRFAGYLLRDVCGLEPVPGSGRVQRWIVDTVRDNPPAGKVTSVDFGTDAYVVLDTSVSSPDYLPAELSDRRGARNPGAMARWINRTMEDHGAIAAIGRYDEYRLIYGGNGFLDFSGHIRTLHLGIDVYQQAGSPVFAALPGVIHSVSNYPESCDYGGVVLIRHELPGEFSPDQSEPGERNCFYTLYGHLDPGSISSLTPGASVAAGEKVGRMGAEAVNGEWPPHLHFQIILDLLSEQDTFFGVASHQHCRVWRSICPDPGPLLGIPKDRTTSGFSDAKRSPERIEQQRRQSLSPSLSLSYREPLLMARGVGQYLYDYSGRQFLDAVNNVPHVGHCHPAVVQAGQRAATTLSTNTRYLYPGLTRYAERLLARLPDHLEVIFMVNSGSEANDLALRIARQHTGNRQLFVLDHGYHGNLSSLIDLSPYKHNGKGGAGAPEWVHAIPLPVEGVSPPKNDLEGFIERTVLDCGAAAAVFAESISGCGGQVLFPEGYLQRVFQAVRQQGGLCIADEVQTGFGRVGSHFWAFETQGVSPDMVTMGKPAGNGHPLGIVATTRAVADSFNNGMEYFNTFGGNPVSCAIGEAVLDVMEAEDLQRHAERTGRYLLDGLRVTTAGKQLVSDVRGLGLFLGVELRNVDGSPAGIQAGYIVESMKQQGILISRDGPHNNVLKIKPPMVFDQKNADQLCRVLGEILLERWAQAV